MQTASHLNTGNWALRWDRWKVSPFFWLLVLFVCIRLRNVLVFIQSPHLVPVGDDMGFYLQWALRIAGGQWTDGHAFYGMPGYAYTLAGFLAVLRSPDLVAAVMGILQSLMDGWTAVMLLKLGQWCFPEDRDHADSDHGKQGMMSRGSTIGLLAGCAWLLSEPAQAFSLALMPTAWMICAFWSLVWICATCRETFRKGSIWNPWLPLGFVLGLITTQIATLLMLIPLVVVALAMHVHRDQPWLRRSAAALGAAALFAFGVAAGIAPAWIHNYYVAKDPCMLSAHSGLNFYIGNNPIANGYPKFPPGIRPAQSYSLQDSIDVAEKAAGRPLLRSEVSRYWSEKAQRWINENPDAWRKLSWTKLFNFWNANVFDDVGIMRSFANGHITLPGVSFGLAAILGLPGIVWCGWRWRRSWWVIAAILLHMSAIMPVFVNERYRLAAMPGLLLLGAAVVVQFWASIRTRSPARIVAIASAIFLSALWVNAANPNADRGLAPYKAGVAATRFALAANASGDSAAAQTYREEAVRELEIAHHYAPKNAEILFALGNARHAAGEIEKARIAYESCLALDVRHHRALSNLGILAMESKDFALAERCFTLAAAEHGDARRLSQLAQVQLLLGKREAALENIDKALKLQPDNAGLEKLRTQIIEATSAPSPEKAPPELPR